MKLFKIFIFFVLIFTYCSSSSPFIYLRSIETLTIIEEIINNKEKGALLRFGDGDLALAYGSPSGTHQFS